MLAHVVARPVLERLAGGPGPATVLGAGRTAAYLRLDDWVVAVTVRGVPLMPNGVALVAAAPGRPPAGTRVEAGASGLRGPGEWSATWEATAPPAWDPSVPRLTGADPAALGARGAAIHSAGVEVGRAAPEAVHALLAAVAGDDPGAAAVAAEGILGRGPGLTPEGDDLLAAIAAVVAATGRLDARWHAALAPPDLRERTTPLSATLLELATAGQVMEPVRALLDLSPAGAAAWPAALRRLERVGHSTGPAYAAGVAAALALASPTACHQGAP